MISAFGFWDTAAKKNRVRFTDDGKLLFIMDLDDFIKLPAVRAVVNDALSAREPARE